MDPRAPVIGDALAIPFFAVLALYFLAKPSRTSLEAVLLVFAVAGFLADSLFTLQRVRAGDLIR